MKHVSLIVLSILCLSLHAQTEIGHKPGYNLVWHDEFEDSVISEQWALYFPWGPWAGGKQHFGGENNRLLDSGYIILVLRDEYINGEVFDWDEDGNFTPYYREFDYTGGMLYSHQGFLHGIFETRFKSDAGKGLHNAFWLYGEEAQEIDIFEIYGSNNREVQMTLHWQDREPLTGSTQSANYRDFSPNYTDEFQVMGVKWTADDLIWYINDEDVVADGWTSFIRSRHIPDLPLHIIINNAISGFDGDPDENTTFPSNLYFDYVRAYQNDTVVRKPVIMYHRAKEYANYQPIEMGLNELMVSDYYQTYPVGFRLEILGGEGYAVVENKPKVDTGVEDTVWVNIRVNDGIQYSDTFLFQLYPADVINEIESVSQEENLWTAQQQQGELILSSKQPVNAELMVFDATGKRVLQQLTNGNETKVNLASQPAGNYLIYVLAENEVLHSQTIFWKN